MYHKTYYTYILKCSDGKYYVGVTNNMDRRLEEHNMGSCLGSFTHNRRPVTLVYVSDSNDINDAIAWEKQLQGWSRKKKKLLIAGKIDEIIVYSNKKKRRASSGSA